MFCSLALSSCMADTGRDLEGKHKMNFKDPKTICLGKIQFQVPNEAHIKYGDFSYNGVTINIEDGVYSKNKYEKIIFDRLQELKSSPHEKQSSLLTKEELGPISNGRESVSHIIVYRDGFYVNSVYDIEAYLIKNGRLFTFKNEVSNDYLEQGIDGIKYIMQNLSYKVDYKKINKIGVCWKDIYIVDEPEKFKPFSTEAFITFPSYPGVWVEFDHRIRISSDLPLLKMIRDNDKEMPAIVDLNIKHKYIKEEEKNVNGLSGEQYMGQITRRFYHERGYEAAVWQHLGTLGDMNDPLINVRMETAQYPGDSSFYRSNISQRQAIQLNDFIINSIQPIKNNH